jgi:hypothetical protein
LTGSVLKALFQGRKKWTFYSRNDTFRLYRNSLDKKFAKNGELPAGEVRSSADRYEIILQPGELLFVPAGVPHQVENLDNTIAMAGNYIDGSNAEFAIEQTRLDLPASVIERDGYDLMLRAVAKGRMIFGEHADQDLDWDAFKAPRNHHFNLSYPSTEAIVAAVQSAKARNKWVLVFFGLNHGMNGCGPCALLSDLLLTSPDLKNTMASFEFASLNMALPGNAALLGVDGKGAGESRLVVLNTLGQYIMGFPVESLFHDALPAAFDAPEAKHAYRDVPTLTLAAKLFDVNKIERFLAPANLQAAQNRLNDLLAKRQKA